MQANLCTGGEDGGYYNKDMLECDLKKLLKAAARYAGL